MDDCLICRKHRGEPPAPGGVIYEDDLVYASHIFIPDGRDRVYLGWLVLEPKRRAPGLQDLTGEEAERFGVMQTRIARALKEAAGAEHIYAFVLGHHVDHLHLHIAARHPGTPREYWALQMPEWPDAPQGDEAEIGYLVERMRALLAE